MTVNSSSGMRQLAIGLFACFMVIAMFFVPWQSSASQAQSAEPTFLIFKYQHPVGEEMDVCTDEPAGKRCHSHFQLDFTGSSIALDADIQTDRYKRAISYIAKGQNSTRSFVDLNIAVAGNQATITENGAVHRSNVPQTFFT